MPRKTTTPARSAARKGAASPTTATAPDAAEPEKRPDVERDASAAGARASEPAHEEARRPRPTPGRMVSRTYFDPYVGAGGEDRTVHGIVVAVDDAGARVAWFTDVSDPVPLDELES